MTCLPKYQTALAAGLDLPSAEFGVLPPQGTLIVDTGLTLDDLLTIEDRAIPVHAGFILEAQIRPRSGLMAKHSISCHLGTIDLDYKDNIKVILINLGKEKHDIHPGDRVAQLVFSLVYRPINLVSSTLRQGGFGSTGVEDEQS